MAVSKRLRYEVLARDNSTCQTCGRRAPEWPLTVDHVIPVTLGGTDEPSNLVTKCSDCNNGKSSSSPDAPAVAAVSESALAWSAAMKQAQADMLADVKARQAECRKFEKWWNVWGTGSGADRCRVPKDPGWQTTVGQLVSAGLPLDVLKGCIDLAMNQRKVLDENKFRYMCGIAWNKVTELQKAARRYAGALDPDPDPTDDRYDDGRLDAAREVLDELSPELQAEFIKMVDDGGYGATCGDPQSDTDRLVTAAAYALGTYRTDQSAFDDRAFLLFEEMPGDLGERVFKSARTVLYERWGPDFSRALFTSRCLHDLVDELRLSENEALIAELTSQEEGEYVAFATMRFWDDHYSEAGWTARIADAIRAGRTGQRSENMCCGTGNHIPFCPNAGDFMARIAEFPCCNGEETDPWHQGHRFCSKHMEDLTGGTFRTPDGMTLTATESRNISETAPF